MNLKNFFFKFYIGGLINNVVLVSDVQQSDLVIHIYVFILFQTLWTIELKAQSQNLGVKGSFRNHLGQFPHHSNEEKDLQLICPVS